MANGSDRDLRSAFAETPIETYVNALFALAVKKRTSDTHLEPQNAELCVRLRVDVLLYRIASPPSAVANKLCARSNVMASMNIPERRLPQDGRFPAIYPRRDNLRLFGRCDAGWANRWDW